MPCLGLPEEVEFDVNSDGLDIDDGEDQEEARELNYAYIMQLVTKVTRAPLPSQNIINFVGRY
jgi:hypothetical protein